MKDDIHAAGNSGQSGGAGGLLLLIALAIYALTYL